ncbi:sugar transferase [Acinetobacter pseudolwoffii]|uniref:sugar transferase n=1 Tax=Acinetobacter pseudolwoffii TaxID=2053287 RepID=UPI002577270D|nr:sugar transferase [Acinetobacter pseudolwoffii]MDM1324949.1 sugar transferase [Acinetobacter pseudolwoffii]
MLYKLFFKRFLDFVASLVVLILLSPIFLAVTILLGIANKGSPFFFQQRPGKNEKIFKIIKFKTMNEAKDSQGNLLPDAQRLTKVGGFIRKTSLDEMPQLINVIKGDMSLIGPRPLFVRYLPYYTNREALRHTVRPGITGLAQVNGRNFLDWNSRLELDAQYVENISLITDIKIALLTIKNVIARKDIAVIPGAIGKPLDIERSKQ